MMITPTLKLFNAIQVSKKKIRPPFNKSVLNKTMKHGFILDPNIDFIVNNIINVIGINGKNLNSSFHKSWKKVKYERMENLVMDQLVHYITTYGFEQLGIFDSDRVFIPNEKLEVPEIKDDFSLLYIKALTKEEILEKIIDLCSGIALGQETIDLVMEIIVYNSYSSSIVEEIGNRELKNKLYDYYGIVPTEPVEYLRYVIYKLTGETLLIKNKYLTDRIKMSDYIELNSLLDKAPDNLASIFHRYKPLFLAMKHVTDDNTRNNPMFDVLKPLSSGSNVKTFINQLRKKAKHQHKPLPKDYFNSITEQISKGKLDLFIFKERLSKISIYRKIRLAYSLNYRLQDNGSIVYKIRNGKSWATELNDIKNNNLASKALTLLKYSIINDISNNVFDKKIYIPENVNYSLPSTEKSFVGNIPSNSYISLDKDIIVGVHWFNQKNRVDLDLSMIGNNKIGWDGEYRSGDKKVLFSGDMTDAPKPNGAAEMFYINEAQEEPWVLNLNNYTYGYSDNYDNTIPFKFFIANKKLKRLDKNHMVDPNDIVFHTEMSIKDSHQVLGLIIKKNNNDTRFYFSNFSSGNSITSNAIDDVSKHTKNYLIGNTINNVIDMKDILVRAGAILTDSKDGCDIDLSPESLDKTTIINLLK